MNRIIAHTSNYILCHFVFGFWAEIGQNFLSLNQHNLGESILNIVTHITNISNVRRFEAIQRDLWGHKKIWFTYIYIFVNFCYFL